jgi:two-component system response regulator (stage 0 sporulation protein A)
MNSLSSVAIIMAELSSIKNLLNKQNEFLGNIGFSAPEEIEHAAEMLFQKEPMLVPAKPVESIDYRISSFLQELRIPTHQLGFGYLKEAIKMAYNDETVLSGITKVLYPTVANKFNTTGSRAERAIRHAIETSWYKNVQFHPHKFYEYYDEKPTNSAFVADVVEKLKLEEN